MPMFEGPSARSFAQRSRCAGRSDGGHSLIGIYADRTCETLIGSFVTASGHKLEADYRHQFTERLKVPDRLREVVSADSFQQFPTGTQGDGAAYATWIQEISLLQADLIRRLCRSASMPIDDVLAVGLLGPGCWYSAKSGQRCYLELCDPARVAEAVGCNVVSQFPQRDLAVGGLGGPLHAVPQWLLLGESEASRLLLDVGRSVRLTFIPRGRSEEILDQVLSFDVGPGTALLDELSLR
ncbi:MAG: anhydro-N-acetylmuramic acid kinase, partial [Planctomycetota bacterium]|nr:anhydro-N-acetylmuramic acid kinase [Planctomycetota bacterium]